MFPPTRFLLSVADLQQLPPDVGNEVAFAGRSNAGKSSAINAICARQKLAFVSRTPGRTQLINYFQVGEAPRYLVDLPGYGYARVPAQVRARWDRLLGDYLQTRFALRGLLLVMDARRPLTSLDRRMLDWFAPRARPVLAILTKADKLTRQVAQERLAETSRVLAGSYRGVQTCLFSSVTGVGVEQARARLGEWLQLDRA